MRDSTYISNIDDLKKWFEINQAGGKEPRPYFTLYRGYEAKNDRYILSNKEISDPEAAWELLENMLEMYQDGGGQFRLFITDRPGHNFGMTTYVKLPARNPAVAGVHGVASQNYGIYGSMREMFDAEMAKQRKIWEMEQKIEMMEAGQSGIGTVETIRQIFEAVPALNPLAHAIGMKILGMAPNAPAPASPAAGAPAPGETINGVDPEGYDYDVVEPALDKMRRVFPNVEMTLDKLADWVNQNPDMARNLFGNLNQPTQ